MTFRINVSFDHDGTRRAELEVEPASDSELEWAQGTFAAVLRQLVHPTADNPQVPEVRPR